MKVHLVRLSSGIRLALGALAFAPLGAFAADQTADAAPTLNALTAIPHISIVNPISASVAFDFGAVRSGDKVDHTFIIRNDGPGAFVLDHAQSSCDCTSAILMDQFGNGQPKLEPGQTAQVKATLDTSKISPSEISTLEGSLVTKTIWVYVDGQQDHPAVVLRMQGHVTPGIAFDPPAVSFGSVSERTGVNGKVRVIYDADRYAEGKTAIVASDPRVNLKLISTKTTAGSTEQQYQVVIPPHAAVGNLSGIFTVVGAPGVASPVPASFTAPFAGEIVGDVHPEPLEATYGSVRAKDEHGKPLSAYEVAQSRVRWILLVNDGPNAAKNTGVWKQAQVKTDAPWLRATLVEPPKPGVKPAKAAPVTPPDISARKPAPGTVRWVRIELLPTAKSKTWLSANVTVTLANGEQILVPASGQIE